MPGGSALLSKDTLGVTHLHKSPPLFNHRANHGLKKTARENLQEGPWMSPASPGHRVHKGGDGRRVDHQASESGPAASPFFGGVAPFFGGVLGGPPTGKPQACWGLRSENKLGTLASLAQSGPWELSQEGVPS